MRQTFRFSLLFSIVAYGDTTQTANLCTIDATSKVPETFKQVIVPATSNPYGFDTTYEIQKATHRSLGYFDTDSTVDTAVLIRHKTMAKTHYL